jgi:DUF4097 and DUF4098 domain-containing protein YvlB
MARKSVMRKPFLWIVLLVVAALALAGCDNRFTADETFSQTLDTPASPRIVVETFNGNVSVTAGAGGKLEANVIKHGSGDSQAAAEADLKNIDVMMKTEGDTIRIVARRTDSRPANNSGVSFVLTAPASAALDLRTSNGNVMATGMTGDVTATSSNGRVQVDGGQGRIDLSTSNGEIEIDATAARVTARTSNGAIRFSGSLADGNHTFDTSNGSITLKLPSDARFRVSASTRNGDVTSDFAVTTSGSLRKGALDGTLGENPAVSLQLGSSNGNIDIRKGQ